MDNRYHTAYGMACVLSYKIFTDTLDGAADKTLKNMPVEWRLGVDQSGVARRSVTQTSAAERLAAKIRSAYGPRCVAAGNDLGRWQVCRIEVKVLYS